jgi:hypothetical protein
MAQAPDPMYNIMRCTVLADGSLATLLCLAVLQKLVATNSQLSSKN